MDPNKFELVKGLQAIRREGAAPPPYTPEPVPVAAAPEAGTSGGGGGSSIGGALGLKGAVRAAMRNHGWSDSEWGALDTLIQKESSWNPTIKNPNSTAWGLFQFLDMHYGPGGYLPNGRNSSVAEQIAGGLRYIKERYGSPSRALNFHRSHNWY